MDILLQYLNERKQKQEFVKITGVPCNSVYQSVHHSFGIYMDDRALDFIDSLKRTYKSDYLFVGILDARYCKRATLATLSYADFYQLTCGLGETSSID